MDELTRIFDDRICPTCGKESRIRFWFSFDRFLCGDCFIKRKEVAFEKQLSGEDRKMLEGMKIGV